MLHVQNGGSVVTLVFGRRLSSVGVSSEPRDLVSYVRTMVFSVYVRTVVSVSMYGQWF
jgi:hypothetical protein